MAILLSGLKRLEYRGYDSAGIGLVTNDPQTGSALKVVKKLVSLPALIS